MLLMHKPLNRTNIYLIPKVSNPTIATQFRPIACYNTLYKLIFKILMIRLRKGISFVIGPTLPGFIPRTQLIENILLVTKLVKGHGRGQMSHRFLIKIDLRKAYD